jgi:hypothetical protein
MSYQLYKLRPIQAEQNEDGSYTMLIWNGATYDSYNVPKDVFERNYQPYDGTPAQIDIKLDDGTTFKQPTDEEIMTADVKAAQANLNQLVLRSVRAALVGADVTSIKSDYETALASISDDAACKMCMYFPVWIPLAHQYKKGDRVNYNGVLYKCLFDHVSQVTWKPDKSPSLFTKVLTSDDGTPQEWEQPNSTNPYMKGDKVTYQGKIYESTIDNNILSPTEFPQGWKEVTQ